MTRSLTLLASTAVLLTAFAAALVRSPAPGGAGFASGPFEIEGARRCGGDGEHPRADDLQVHALDAEVGESARDEAAVEIGVEAPEEDRLDWDGLMGANARLTGRIHLSEEGVPARFAILRGPNMGVEFESDDRGNFHSQKLLPGLSWVEIRPARRAAFQRVVVLRPHRDHRLVLDLARSPDVEGRVEDESGQPLSGVEVHLDGVHAITDSFGGFRIPRVASGRSPLVARAKGKADARVWVGGERGRGTRSPLRLRMEPSCSIRIESGEASGGPERVLLLPEVIGGGGAREASFPWESLPPLELGPTGQVDVDGLPAGTVRVVSIGRDSMGETHVTLRPEQRAVARPRRVARPRLQGSVDLGDSGDGVRIELRAAPVKTVAIALGRDASAYYRQALDPMPCASITTSAGARGHFDLPWWDTGGRPQVLRVLRETGPPLVRMVQNRAEDLRISL